MGKRYKMFRQYNKGDGIPLGENIRSIREKQDISQLQMVLCLQVKGISMSRSTYAKIETGSRNIEASCLEAIKEILNTTYEMLFKKARHIDR